MNNHIVSIDNIISFNLDDNETKQIIDIINGMISVRNGSTKSLSKNPKTPKSPSKAPEKDYTWGDRVVSYSVEKFGTGFIVQYAAFAKGQQLMGKKYVSEMMRKVFGSVNMTEVKYVKKSGKEGSCLRPFFKTEEEAHKYIATLPTTLSGAECKAINDQIFARWEDQKQGK